MQTPLFAEGLGEFSAVQVLGFAPRHILADIRRQRGEERKQARSRQLRETVGVAAGPAAVEETPHTIRYTQAVQHPRLEWATRSLEIWRGEPRVRLTFRLNRRSSAAPEIFYLAFPLPTGETLPTMSCGGQPFTPFADQLGATCKDYFALDGWVDVSTPVGRWLWVSRDAPLVSLGSDSTLAGRDAPPKDVNRLMAMLFNNFWYTNFVADEHGIMEFQFDLAWHPDGNLPSEALAEALTLEPLALINPSLPEDPRLSRRLYEP